MNSLEKGILYLDDFELSSETNLEEFEEAFSESCSKSEWNETCIFNFGVRIFEIYGQKFFIRTVQFSKKGYLSHIELTPVKTIPGTAYMGQQNIDFTVSVEEDWLQGLLGFPQTEKRDTNRVCFYNYSWGSIGYYCLFDRHDMCYYGNKIEIDYRRYISKVEVDPLTMTAHIYEEVEE